MTAAFSQTAELLGQRALSNPAVLVFYSGGKDSLAVMDLCVRSFRRVIGVHMDFVPGLAVMEERLDLARRRWGVEFYFTPHWMLSDFLRLGVYCNPVPGVGHVGLPDVFAHVRKETGIPLIAHGGKLSDGLWRRWKMATGRDEDLIHPLSHWNKYEVLAYLKAREIPAAEKFDLDLGTANLLWLYDNHPEDFRRVCQFFPHAEAVIHRREWYGIEE